MNRPLSHCWLTSAEHRLARSLPVALLIACVACGANSGTSTPAQAPAASSATASPGAPDIAAADGVTAYFHEQLVANGEDVQSDFGSALLTLGMNPRDLQQDTPEHAYQTALRNVQAVKDPALTSELTRALFGSATPPSR